MIVSIHEQNYNWSFFLQTWLLILKSPSVRNLCKVMLYKVNTCLFLTEQLILKRFHLDRFYCSICKPRSFNACFLIQFNGKKYTYNFIDLTVNTFISIIKLVIWQKLNWRCLFPDFHCLFVIHVIFMIIISSPVKMYFTSKYNNQNWQLLLTKGR